MRNYFTFDGKASTDFGVYLSGQGVYGAPARTYDIISVKGRNGELVGIGNQLENIEVTYPGFIYASMDTNLADLRAYLLSRIGYKRLEDTFHPNEFRKAIYAGPFEPEITMKRDAGSFDIVFRCMPQRFLKSGETDTTLTANGSISNPTRFDSQPLLKVTGTGTFYIGSQAVTISSASGATFIDCEMMDCYKSDGTSRNEYVSFADYKFPTLAPGSNSITLGTGITAIIITPRWWTV